MKPFRSRIAPALAFAFLLLFSLQVSVALADDPVVPDPAAVPPDPVAAPTTVPEDPGFVPPAVPEIPPPIVPLTPEDPGFGV